jgi:hypothetical protein
MRRVAGLFGALGAMLVLLGAAASAQTPRPAVLHVSGDVTCNHKTMIDHMVDTQTIPLMLPEISGPVKGQGTYSMKGTGYAMSGIAAYAGEVRDDAELILTYGQWNYQGKWLFSEDPGVPTQRAPVVIPLEDGGETKVTFVNAWADKAPCSGTVTYRIEFKREEQVWDIALGGHARIVFHGTFNHHDEKTGAVSPLPYTHGFTFTYQMGANAVLERRKGQWTFKSATITAAGLKPTYEQSQPIYKVVKQGCNGCDSIAALKGRAISGGSDGTTLTLNWPDPFREAWVDTVFALKCPPGPNLQSCLNKKQMGSRFAQDDGYFLDRASPHPLPLVDGSVSFSDGRTTTSSTLEIRHVYTLKRLK